MVGMIDVVMWAVGISLVGAAYRFFRGVTLPDRVVALDTIATNLVVVAALLALARDSPFYISIALVIAVVGFLSTVAVSKFLVEDDIVE